MKLISLQGLSGAINFLFLSCKALFLIHQILRMNYDFDEFDVRYLAKNRIRAKTVPHDFFFIVRLS